MLTRRAALIELRDEAVALRWPACEVAATAVDDVLLDLDDELVAAVEQGRLDRDTACEALSKAGSLGHRARLPDEDVLTQAEIALTMEMEDGDELWCDARAYYRSAMSRAPGPARSPARPRRREG